MQLFLALSVVSANAILLRPLPDIDVNRSFVHADAAAYDEQMSVAASACTEGPTCRMLKSMRVCGTCAGGAAQMVRLGAQFDGGYVTCPGTGSASAFSLGINGVDDWGVAVSQRYGIPVHEYDCTNPTKPKCPFGSTNCKLHFFHECVDDGSNRFARVKTLAQMLQRPDIPVPGGDVLLKMDVEGAEWGSFQNADRATLRRFNQIAVEFHFLKKTERHAEFADVVEKLLQDFVIVHTHGNTCCGVYRYMGFSLPSVFEVTFVRRDGAQTFPCLSGRTQPELDRPNHPGRQNLTVALPA